MEKGTFISLLGLLPLASVDLYAQQKPNVLFIFADDMTYNCMGNIGPDELHTPNLDELRGNGMYFTHAFNQGGWNGAISVASRSMLVTGRYLWKAKEVVSDKAKVTDVDASRPLFWPQYMKQAGYDTYMTGKWHVAVDAHKVFDVARHVRGGMPRQTQAGYAASTRNPQGRKFVEGEADAWQPYKEEYGGYWEGGRHWSEVVGDDAVDYIRTAGKRDDPFFMYIAFNAPHDPRQSPKRFVDMYPVNRISIPENFQPLYPYYREIGCGEGLRDEQLAPFPRTEYSVKVNRQEYYAIISHMDEQIGRILDALKASGEYDNTYIIFSADHGLAVGDHGLIGKQNMYDASMRVPLIICGPGVKKGRCEELVYLQDAMATAMDIAGSSHLDAVDFKSLLPLARKERKAETVCAEEAVYGAYINLQRMVRTDRYKLVLYLKNNVVRLYDLKKDPHEMNDLAGKAKYRKIADELFGILLSKQLEVGDEVDVKSAYEAYWANKQE